MQKLVVQDLYGDRATPVQGSESLAPLIVRWLAPIARPVPTALVIGTDSIRMQWGERRPVSVRLGLSDGALAPADGVAWASSDPSVVSVSAAGEFSANGIGVAEVTAEWDGWIRRSLGVRVTGEREAGALLTDDFRLPDPGPRSLDRGW